MAFRKELDCGRKVQTKKRRPGCSWFNDPCNPQQTDTTWPPTTGTHHPRRPAPHTPSSFQSRAHGAYLLLGQGQKASRRCVPGCGCGEAGGQLVTGTESSARNLHDVRKNILNCAVTAPGRSNPRQRAAFPTPSSPLWWGRGRRVTRHRASERLRGCERQTPGPARAQERRRGACFQRP